MVGVDLSVFDIGAIDEGDFYVKFHLRLCLVIVVIIHKWN